MEEIIMKRLALVLAASVLGLGCGSSSSSPPPPPPTGTLDLSWSFIRTKNDLGGTHVTYGCTQAGIDSVVVSTAGGSVALACADQLGDGGAVGLAPGTYNNVTVTAYRGGIALYHGTFNGIVILVNQTTPISAPLDAFFAPLQINTDFYAAPFTYVTCGSAGVTNLSINLVDSAGTSVYSNGSISCTDPPGITFGAGNPVDLDQYTIRVVATGPSFEYDTAVLPGCTSPVFNHYANDTGAFAWTVTVDDVTGGPFCP
jgi:hypothetical protein